MQTFISLINAYNFKQMTFTGDNLYYKRGMFNIDYNGIGFTSIMDNGIGAFLLDPENN